MQKLPIRVKRLAADYRHAAFFLLFAAVYILYFLLQLFRAPVYVIHSPLDDLIPFCEWFVIPYVAWYAYISLPMLYLFFKSRDDFIRMAVYLFSGMFLCLAIFWVFPNSIDFRPAAFPRNNLLTDLVKLIYQNDKPTNVCPSLHCYEAIAIHLSLVKSQALKGHAKIKILSFITAVLICLSTMFIKQHSLVDVLCGIALAIILYFITQRIFYYNNTKGNRN